jgi:hypothetical protein
LLDSETLSDVLEMTILEGKKKKSALLEVYSNERVKAFQMFANLQSTQHKLRVQSDPERAHQIG